MPNENKVNIEVKEPDLVKLVTELRQTVESKTASLSENKEKVEKLSVKVNEIEEKNQELTKIKVEAENDAKELNERIDVLEKNLARLPAGNRNEKSKEVKAFETFIRTNSAKYTPEILEELKYLRTDNNQEGGFLVPTELSNEIIKKITEFDPIRALARVRPIGARTVIPTRATLVSGGWAGEGEQILTSNSTYGAEQMTLHKLPVNVEITWEDLWDSAFNMETEIQSDVAEMFAQVESEAFVKGNANKKPEGFMVNPDVPSINTGVANVLTFDSILKLTGELKTGYNPVFGFNRKTLVDIMLLKDGVGNYLWMAGNVAADVPSTIRGFTYYLMPSMDDVAADNYPVIFADFKKGYMIGDSAQIIVIKDEYTKKLQGKVEFTFARRTNGQVVLPEALVKLKVSV